MNVDALPMKSRQKPRGAAGVTGRRARLHAELEDVFAIELVYRRRVIQSPRKTAMVRVLKTNDAKCRVAIVSIFLTLHLMHDQNNLSNFVTFFPLTRHQHCSAGANGRPGATAMRTTSEYVHVSVW